LIIPLVVAIAIGATFRSSMALPAPSNPESARQAYRDAKAHLANDRLNRYRQAKSDLSDYPLVQYLDYYQLRRNIRRISQSDVAAFQQVYTETPLAGRLLNAWLKELARRNAWQDLVEQYQPSNHTELRCYYLSALHRTGQRKRALRGVPDLWLVATSQPKACDPIFEVWIDADQLTEDMVWERIRRALSAGETTLARYLQRFLNGDLARWGHTFYQVHRNPKLIRNHDRFSIDNEYIRNIIADALPRLVRTDPNDARTSWAHYQSSHAFAPGQARRIEQDLTVALARRGEQIAAANLSATVDGRHLELADALLQNAVRRQDWVALLRWYDALPEQQQTEPKWRYWHSRALAASDHPRSDPATAQVQLTELAALRHYYGFLAADHLGTQPRLNARPSSIDATVLTALRNRAGVIRIEELLAIDDQINANREWRFLQPRLSPAELGTAAYLAADLGWIQQSIMVANTTELRDDLDLRFPTPHLDLFAAESSAAAVPIGFLYGIARQESAFAAAAESPAGAVGMMQLLPSTAALTARRMGVAIPVRRQLKQADLNVKLGSRYLATLMDRYDGNRALSAAAYNAGPRRVDRWLGAVPAQPVDVWIESVPFRETRSYVKNVLAFSYIYSERLGKPTRFLDAPEG
jgi:soluble lytic murein transglycosylase